MRYCLPLRSLPWLPHAMQRLQPSLNLLQLLPHPPLRRPALTRASLQLRPHLRQIPLRDSHPKLPRHRLLDFLGGEFRRRHFVGIVVVVAAPRPAPVVGDLGEVGGDAHGGEACAAGEGRALKQEAGADAVEGGGAAGEFQGSGHAVHHAGGKADAGGDGVGDDADGLGELGVEVVDGDDAVFVVVERLVVCGVDFVPVDGDVVCVGECVEEYEDGSGSEGRELPDFAQRDAGGKAGERAGGDLGGRVAEVREEG
mmetsp:Transcript_13662/g.34797  ORF Transcript_13662/g.34797 Transcript_13662/m.34797 type:complete len:255 (+) Transcript_13662:2252-3016(+)